MIVGGAERSAVGLVDTGATEAILIVAAVVGAVTSALACGTIRGLTLVAADTAPAQWLLGVALIVGAEVACATVGIAVALHANVSRAVVEASVALAAGGALHTRLGRRVAIVRTARAVTAAGTITSPRATVVAAALVIGRAKRTPIGLI